MIDFKKEENRLVLKLIISLVFLFILMYYAIGYNMGASFRLIPIHNDLRALSIVECLSAFMIILVNYKIFVNALKALTKPMINIYLIASIISIISFLYSYGLMKKIVYTNIYSIEGYQSIQQMTIRLNFVLSGMIIVFVDIINVLRIILKDNKNFEFLKPLSFLFENEIKKDEVYEDNIDDSIKENNMEVNEETSKNN